MTIWSGITPVFCIAQWRFARFGRQILIYFWQRDRKVFFFYQIGQIVFPIHRNWFTPIALAAEYRIAQFILNFTCSQFLRFQPLDQCGSAGFVIHAINHPRIDITAFFCSICFRINAFLSIEDRNNGQMKMLRKIPVALVTRRYAHHCACSIPSQYIICDINRYFFVVKRVYRVCTCESTTYFFALLHPLYIAATAGPFDIRIYFVFLCRSCNFVY